MDHSYRLIIVGAGIVGSSVAYHLSLLGWKDILVVDKGPLFENHGSTSHAPGGMHVINGSRMMTNFAVYSVECYKKLKEIEEGTPPVRQVGGLEVAHTASRWEDIKRKAGYAASYRIEVELLTPKETKTKLPIIDDSVIVGSLFCAADTNVLGHRTHLRIFLTNPCRPRTIIVMGRLEEKRERFKTQISELYRLAEEAQACAQLLREQASTHEKLLEDDSLTEEQLDALLADEPKQRFKPNGAFVLTEGLM